MRVPFDRLALALCCCGAVNSASAQEVESTGSDPALEAELDALLEEEADDLDVVVTGSRVETPAGRAAK